MVKAEGYKSSDFERRCMREGSVEVPNKSKKQNSGPANSVEKLKSSKRKRKSDFNEDDSCDIDESAEEFNSSSEDDTEGEKEESGPNLDCNKAETNFRLDLLNATREKGTNIWKRIKNTVKCWQIILLSAFMVSCILHSIWQINNENTSPGMEANNLYKNINKIKQYFPSQESILWKTLYNKIKYVKESNPQRPAVMLLLHNNNAQVAECIAWKVGRAVTQYFYTTDMIEVIGDSNMKETDNELIEQYRDKLRKNGVMIVYRLQKIPGLVAQSFHAFCDTYNPLVKRAVLLFTLDYRNVSNEENIKPNKKALQLMKLLWKDSLVDSKLDALITRLTDTVLKINAENTFSRCL